MYSKMQMICCRVFAVTIAALLLFAGIPAPSQAEQGDGTEEEYAHGANFDIYGQTCPDGCYTYTNEDGFLVLGGQKEFETQGFVWRINHGQFFENDVDESGEVKSCWAAYIKEVKSEAVVEGVLRIPRVLESPESGARYPVKYISYFPGDAGLSDAVKATVAKLVIEADGFRTTGITLQGCTNLESVDANFSRLPANFFKGCSSLKSIEIGVLDSASAEDVFDAYAPWNSSNGPVATPGIGEGCFSGCSSLASVVFKAGHSDGVRWYLTADTSVFRGCTSLQTVVYEAKQPYWTDPDGSMRDATTYDYWGGTGVHPDEYLAVDYYETREDALADDSAQTPNRTHSARLARVEYRRGTPTSLIARSDASLSDCMCARDLYAQTEYDGIVPDPGEGYAWALELPYGAYGELSESCYAYKVAANDLSAGHLVDADGQDALSSMRSQAPKHLELTFDPERYYSEETEDLSVRERTALNAYKRGYSEYAHALSADSTGAVQIGVTVIAADGSTLRSGTDYTCHLESYDPATKEYTDVGASVSSDGPYLLVIEGMEPGYTGRITQWVMVKQHVGSVTGYYGADACDMVNEVVSASPEYAGATERRPYSLVAGGTSVHGLLIGSGFAGLCQTAIDVSKPGSADGAARAMSRVGTRVLSVDVPDSQAKDAGLQYRFSRTGKVQSVSQLAFAMYDAFEKDGASFGASDLAWGDNAVVCPCELPTDCSAIACYAYAMKAPVFFAEPDGGLSDETVSALGHFSKVVVPGDASVTSDATLDVLRKQLPEVEVTRIGEAASDNACSFSTAVAGALVSSGKASWNDVVILDGRDPLNMCAGLTRVGNRGGIILVSCSVCDTKRIAALLQKHRDDISNVSLIASSSTSLGSDSWNPEVQLSAACAGKADVDFGVADTFEIAGCEFERTGDDTAVMVRCFDAPNAFAEGDMVVYEGETYTIDYIPANPGLAGQWRMTMVPGSSRAFNVAGTDASAGLCWSSSDESVAAVGADGKVASSNPGTAYITIRSIDDTGRLIASGSARITVAGTDETVIAGMKDYYAVFVGDAPFNLGASVEDSGVSLEYESSNLAVATVDATGDVKPVSYGETLITVTAFVNGVQVGSPYVATVAVARRVQQLEVAEDVLMIGEGDSTSIEVDAAAETLSMIEYHSEDESIATVDDSGNVLGVSPGITTIYVYSPRTNELEEVTVAVAVAVNAEGCHLSGIEREYELLVGESAEVATETSWDGFVTWEYRSTKNTVARVEGHMSGGKDTIRAVSPGVAFVSFVAKSQGGDVLACWISKVTVKERTAIDMSQASITWLEGSEFAYTGEPVDPEIAVKLDGKTLKWGKDYDVLFRNRAGEYIDPPSESGTYMLVAEGKGAYEGEASSPFKILASGGNTPDQTAEAKRVTAITVNVKNVTAVAVAAAIKKAGGKAADVTTVTLGAKVKTVKSKAFGTLDNLLKITGGKNVTTIAASAFLNQAKLATIPAFAKVTSIGANAFKGCKALKKFVAGSKVRTIGKQAFWGCKALKTVVLGKAVTKIGASAFKGCPKLKTVTIKMKKLAKKGVKNSLKGSKVATIKAKVGTKKANKKAVKKYKRIFTKKVVGRKVSVK